MGALTAADRDLMARYQVAKDEYKHLLFAASGTHRLGEEWPQEVIDASARVDGMKDAAGPGGLDDPLCCQRYGLLHLPVFSVQDCRWLELLGDDEGDGR